MYGMMRDIGPKFYAILSPPHSVTTSQGHGLRIIMLKFYVKVFRISLFPNPLMALVYVWYMYEDIDRLNILHSTIPTLYIVSGSRS